MDAENPELALAAVRKILAKLGDDLELAFNSKPECNWLGYERARYAHALAAVAKFLEANTKSQELARRFYRLALALADLNDGRVDPLLTPSDPTSASATRVWCARAKVALALHAHILAGSKREQAAKEVVSIFPEIGRLAAFERKINPSSTETKALGWYDEFRKSADKSRINNTAARDIFEQGQQLIAAAQLSPEELRAWAKKYLEEHGDFFGEV